MTHPGKKAGGKKPSLKDLPPNWRKPVKWIVSIGTAGGLIVGAWPWLPKLFKHDQAKPSESTTTTGPQSTAGSHNQNNYQSTKGDYSPIITQTGSGQVNVTIGGNKQVDKISLALTVDQKAFVPYETKPVYISNVPYVTNTVFVPNGSNALNSCGLLYQVHVKNVGTRPSIADNFTLELISPNWVSADPSTNFYQKGQAMNFHANGLDLALGGQKIHIQESDAIYQKTKKPLQPGEAEHGWLLFCFEGLNIWQMGITNFTALISFTDVTGTRYYTTNKLGGFPMRKPFQVSGTADINVK